MVDREALIEIIEVLVEELGYTKAFTAVRTELGVEAEAWLVDYIL